MEHPLLKKIERDEDEIIEKVHEILERKDAKEAEAVVDFLGVRAVARGKDFKKAFREITSIARKYEKYLAIVEIGDVTITNPDAVRQIEEKVRKKVRGRVYFDGEKLVIEKGKARITISNLWKISRESDIDLEEIKRDYLKEVRRVAKRYGNVRLEESEM
ncbi:MAG: hypothetical protein J7J91_08740 [Deltaproteobacteria bacterium]|nr:hypothetical protein [Deltaproteobacteria bacterium]